jgi:putative ABC transport system permease protein
MTAATYPPDGGVPARRAVVRWAWRLFRREWRQQLLILLLVVFAVAAIFIGSGVATNSPQPANFGFGTAQDMALYPGGAPKLPGVIAGLERRFGTVEVIDNQTVHVPGSVSTYSVRAQDPHGPYGGPMLSLQSGRWPRGAAEAAVSAPLAATLHLAVGQTTEVGGVSRTIVGIVVNPQSLLDSFVLVPPGQVTAPTTVTILFDAHGFDVTTLGQNYQSLASSANHNPLNPSTVTLGVATIGMLLIGLVAVGGFTVLAQRRMRSIGMLATVGATDKHLRLVVRANGAVVGLVGTLIGALLGVAGWLAYRPSLETSAHHRIGTFALPWAVIVPGMAIAIVATYLAAARPARAVARVPIVAALSGRPAPPPQVHRSAIPGILFFVVAFLLMGLSGATAYGNGNKGPLFLVLGFVALIVGMILFAPFFLSMLAYVGRRAPISVRLAVRDLARYRSRSGPALAAISLGVMIAMVIAVVAASRYSNVLDYVGPNLATNQLLVYSDQAPPPGAQVKCPDGQQCPGQSAVPAMAAQTRTAGAIAKAVGATTFVALESTSATLNHVGTGRNWNGAIYVATPSLLAALGISPSQIDPDAMIVTMRPGMSGLSNMQLLYGNGAGPGGPPQSESPCPAGSCVANPVLQELSALPPGTSAPNTLITEHAVQQLHLQSSVSVQGWFLATASGLTPAQVNAAQQIAASGNLSVETKNGNPSSSEIINWATVFGLVVALGVLAMSVGLLRSETAADLRTLTATGASGRMRRTLTAATAGMLGLLGAVLGTAAAYVAGIGWFSSNSLEGGLGALSSVPTNNLLVVLVGMPLVAAAVAWLLARREPAMLARSPIE